jgi:hypothetical protein
VMRGAVDFGLTTGFLAVAFSGLFGVWGGIICSVGNVTGRGDDKIIWADRHMNPVKVIRAILRLRKHHELKRDTLSAGVTTTRLLILQRPKRIRAIDRRYEGRAQSLDDCGTLHP